MNQRAARFQHAQKIHAANLAQKRKKISPLSRAEIKRIDANVRDREANHERRLLYNPRTQEIEER